MFKEFDLPILFDISTTKSVDKNKLDFVNDGEYDFIGRTTVDWGIQGKLHKLSFEPNPKDSFSLIQVGETVALWREREWYASQNLFLLTPKTDGIKENKLYFQSAINKEMSRYGKEYNSYPTLKSLTVTKIVLPVIENHNSDHEYTVDDIDWQYMRERITELERERITELDAYLKATGLEDYELTAKDKEILSLSRKSIFDEDGTLGNDCEDGVRFGEFFLKNIFGMPIRGTRLTKENRIHGTIPLVTAGEQNEGIAEYIGNEEQQTFENMLTIDMFGNCFYRDYQYKADDNILSFGKDIAKYASLYIATIINRVTKGYNYGKQFRQGSYLQTKIILPIKSDGTPDFDYMERYIRAMEKVVIADVVKYIKKLKKFLDQDIPINKK